MKQRLDLLLVERGLVASRNQAQALIMAGAVSGEGKVLDKPGVTYADDIELHVKGNAPYVSRAGEKLASVAATFGLDFTGRVVLDVGSSTGGFTDYALQNGAARSYCVDVGTGQLSYKLRQDDRVVVMEQTDIRDLRPPDRPLPGDDVRDFATVILPEPADIVVIDVSFISLTKIMDVVARLTKPGAPIVAMVKPQFEAGKPLADRYRGVIPMGDDRDGVLAEVRTWLGEHGFVIEQEADSAVPGAEGNVERFMVLRLVVMRLNG